MKNLLLYSLTLLISLFFISACAGPKPQPRAFGTAENIIQQAEKIGAEDYSPTELTHARERLAAAKLGMENRKYTDVNFLIEQAEINAELAIARSQVAIVRDQVNQKRIENQKLLESLQKRYEGEFTP